MTNMTSELEQILCFDTAIDAEKFCKEKSAVFVIMPEEDPNKFFMISLIIQQLYREILSVADANGGKLESRVMFYADEFGTLLTISSAEMMYSASRSRRLRTVAKLGKGETVTMETVLRICKVLDCDVGDIAEIIGDTKES